jgi:hypothetical protein
MANKKPSKPFAVLTAEERKAWDYMYPEYVPNRNDAWFMMSENFPRLSEFKPPDEPPKKRFY